MGLIDDIKEGKPTTIIIIIMGILVFHLYWTRQKNESMADVGNLDQIKEAVKQVYLADVESIRNLSNVATKLQTDGLTVPTNMNIKGKMNIGSDANSKDFPEWLGLSVENATDAHIRLKTKADENKNVYLINRDGNFRINTHGVGDMFGVNRDGHTYNTHTGDHVHHFIGKGDNPYITISKEGEWAKKSWYLQNVKNDGENKIFRIGVHDEGPKLDIHRNGNVFTGGIVFEKRNKARFIRVGNTDASIRKDYWTLIELRAYDHAGNNVSAGKPVKVLQGSPWENRTPPGKITDNAIFNSPADLSDNWDKGYHGNPGLNVLEIDLGGEIDLAQIELFNRWHADVDWRMDGTTIELIGADGNRNRIIYTGLWHRQYSKEYLL